MPTKYLQFQVKTRIVFLQKTDVSPFRKKITKLHLVMLQGEYFENIHARVMVIVHDTSSECALQMYGVSLKYLLRFIERTRFCDGQTLLHLNSCWVLTMLEK